MRTASCKGYVGEYGLDDDDQMVYCGSVLGIRDIVTFEGETAEEVELAFRESVDFYLDVCASRDESPEVPDQSEGDGRTSSCSMSNPTP